MQKKANNAADAMNNPHLSPRYIHLFKISKIPLGQVVANIFSFEGNSFWHMQRDFQDGFF